MHGPYTILANPDSNRINENSVCTTATKEEISNGKGLIEMKREPERQR